MINEYEEEDYYFEYVKSILQQLKDKSTDYDNIYAKYIHNKEVYENYKEKYEK